MEIAMPDQSREKALHQTCAGCSKQKMSWKYVEWQKGGGGVDFYKFDPFSKVQHDLTLL
jgi:hypothetical protein